MDHYTPDELMSLAKRFFAADTQRMQQRPTGVTRSTWRRDHPIDERKSFPVRLGRRRLTISIGEVPYDCMVWNARGGVGESFDLRSVDAGERLARYTREV